MFRRSGLRKSERRASLTPDGSIVSVAAQLGLLGLSLAMLTDNPLLYSFVVTPVGLLVGAAMGYVSCQLDFPLRPLCEAHRDRLTNRLAIRERASKHERASADP